MIIEINPSKVDGTWQLVAKEKADVWPPHYMAYGRSPAQIEYLVHGILADLMPASAESTENAQMLGKALELLRDYADDDECQFDHHGDCQMHGSIRGTCRNARIKGLLDQRVTDTGSHLGGQP